MFCPNGVDLKAQANYFSVQNELIAFDSREEVCLLRGTDWVCKYGLS
jgi:hypothetical protein